MIVSERMTFLAPEKFDLIAWPMLPRLAELQLSCAAEPYSYSYYSYYS